VDGGKWKTAQNYEGLVVSLFRGIPPFRALPFGDDHTAISTDHFFLHNFQLLPETCLITIPAPWVKLRFHLFNLIMGQI